MCGSNHRLRPSARFAKAVAGLAYITSPILRQHTLAHIAMEGRVRPVAYTRYETMLDGVEMHVVDVALEITLVADGVLPESPLPERQFTVRTALCPDTGSNQSTAEVPFYPPPSAGKVDVIVR